MMSNITGSLAIYQENYDKMKYTIARMVRDLEKYAEKEDASEGYLDRQNDLIENISNFVNIADMIINEVLTSYIAPEAAEDKLIGLAGTIIKILKAGGLQNEFEQINFLKTHIK